LYRSTPHTRSYLTGFGQHLPVPLGVPGGTGAFAGVPVLVVGWVGLVRPVIGHRVLARAARPDSANSAPVPVYPAHKPPSRLGTADSSGRHTSGHTTNLSHQRRGSPTRTGEVAKKNSAYRVIPTRGQRLWSVGECDGPGTGSRGLSQDHIHAAEIRRRDAVMLKDRLVRPETDRADPVTVVAADADPLARIGLRTLVERGADLRWVGYIEESRSVL